MTDDLNDKNAAVNFNYYSAQTMNSIEMKKEYMNRVRIVLDK